MRATTAAICGVPGPPPYSPVVEPSNVAWYEADQALGLSGADVTGWGDAALRGLTFAPVAPAGPTYVEDAGDGYPAVQFNGSTQGLVCATWGAIDLEQDFTFAVVLKRTGNVDGIFLCYGDHAEGLGRLHQRVFAGAAPVGMEVGMISQTPSANDIPGPAVTDNLFFHIFHARRSGGAYYAGIDGAEATLSVPAGTYNPAKLFLGAGRAGGALALPMNCQIRAAAMFQESLAPGGPKYVELRDYWQAKWPNVA